MPLSSRIITGVRLVFHPMSMYNGKLDQTFSDPATCRGRRYLQWYVPCCKRRMKLLRRQKAHLLIDPFQGYGTVSTTADNACLGLRYLLAIEGITGIIFSGFSGGMFFLKITRLHTRAYATFSSCMCLEFGQGLSDRDYLCVESMHPAARRASAAAVRSDDRLQSSQSENDSFPVLMFRLINNNRNVAGGEIVDASINCMAVSMNDASDDTGEHESSTGTGRVSIEAEQVNNGVDSSHRPGPIKKRVYCKLRVTPDVNPFFSNGVWCLRHVLNEKSALLKPSVRHKIAETGSWPSDVNTYSKIRESMADEVQEIVVTFNGISNLTGENVFKTVTYKQEDIYVGYQFARVHYLKDNGKSGFHIQVDPDLLHDIVPQEGGGSEPLGKQDGAST